MYGTVLFISRRTFQSRVVRDLAFAAHKEQYLLMGVT